MYKLMHEKYELIIIYSEFQFSRNIGHIFRTNQLPQLFHKAIVPPK